MVKKDRQNSNLDELLQKKKKSLWLISKLTPNTGIIIGTLAVVFGSTLFLMPQKVEAQITFDPAQTNPFNLSNPGSLNHPSFVDLDNDGDLDLMVKAGNNADFFYYENTGTSSVPNYISPVTNPFGLTTNVFVGIHPTFADLDNDGDLDFIFAASTHFRYHENIGTPSAPNFAPHQISPFGLTNSGLAPFFCDLDGDGDLDLMSGEGGFSGLGSGDIKYHENIGTSSSPNFAAAQTNPFGLVNIGIHNTPNLNDLDGDGDLDLISGANDGVLYYFENTGTTTIPAFGPIQANPFMLTDVGTRSDPVFGDLDGDGDFDLMVGEDSGDFFYFENTSTIVTSLNKFDTKTITIYPNPISTSLRIPLDKVDKNTQVTILSVEGKTIFSTIVFNKNQLVIDAAHWNKGVYILQISNNQYNKSTKFIKH